MWDVDNRSPFAHRAGFLRDAGARSLWCLHLKATFALRPGQQAQFLAPQPALNQGPVIEAGYLISEADIGQPRPLCDLTIIGTALPSREASPERGWTLEARLGEWQKNLQVLPHRQWQNGRPQPLGPALAAAPLDWRAAYGGISFDANPSGVGHLPAEGTLLPQLAPFRTPPEAVAFAPVAFAPVPRDWPARARWAGTYDETWTRRRAPLLPVDLDPRYWQAAPEDQWLAPEGLAGQVLHLEGFRPEPMAIQIPDCTLEVATRFRGRWHQQVPQLQAIEVNLDLGRLTLLWLATLVIEAAQNDILVDRSFIALHKSQGFAVAAQDMALFTRPWEAS